MNLFSMRNIASAVLLTGAALAASAQCYLDHANPAEGNVTYIKDVKLYVKTPQGNAAEFNPAVWEDASLKNVKLKNEAGTVVRTYTLSQQNDWDGQGYYFAGFGDSDITTDGTYTLTLPANLFSSSDGVLQDGNNEINVT